MRHERGWGNEDGGQRSNKSIVLSRSTDLGDKWETTLVRNARGKTDAAVEDSAASAVVVDSKSAGHD